MSTDEREPMKTTVSTTSQNKGITLNPNPATFS